MEAVRWYILLLFNYSFNKFKKKKHLELQFDR